MYVYIYDYLYSFSQNAIKAAPRPLISGVVGGVLVYTHVFTYRFQGERARAVKPFLNPAADVADSITDTAAEFTHRGACRRY